MSMSNMKFIFAEPCRGHQIRVYPPLCWWYMVPFRLISGICGYLVQYREVIHSQYIRIKWWSWILSLVVVSRSLFFMLVAWKWLSWTFSSGGWHKKSTKQKSGFSSESRWFELRKKWKNHEETQQMGTVNAGVPAISIDLLNTYHHVWELNPDDS